MILNSIVVGKARKSAGNLTTQNWKGITVGRQKPTQVANPQTAGQTAQRTKLSIGVKIYRMIAVAVAIGFSQLADKMSAYNAFIKHNLLEGAFSSNGGAPIADWNKFAVAKGSLFTKAMNFAHINPGGVSIDLEWESDLSGDQKDTDDLYAVVISAAGTVKFSGYAGAQRVTGNTQILPAQGLVFAGGDKVLTFFYQPSSRKVSDSTLATAN